MDEPSESREYRKSSFEHWMRRVLKDCVRAGEALEPDAVHDLRVSLRHCISAATAVSEFDPDRGWKRVSHSARQLLKQLGRLRDSQVLLDWFARLGFDITQTGEALKRSLEEEKSRFRSEAASALASFDLEKWKSVSKHLSSRARCIEPESLAAKYVCLRRWETAFGRHRFALRSRSNISFHRLRIAIKDFRYSLEWLLPELHASCAADLKILQDALGERHDLDVLSARVSRFLSHGDATKAEWQARISAEREQRLAKYLAKTKGKNSLWHAWRAALPEGKRLDEAAVAALGVWSSFRTPDFAHARSVAALAVELYDLLASRGFADGFHNARPRHILQAAALMQDAGRSEGNKRHHKRAYGMIRRLPLPIGWKSEDLRLTALVARYHRKALPQLKHEEFRALSSAHRQTTLYLAGILRLANCFAQSPGKTVRKFSLDLTSEGMVIQVYGFSADESFLSKLATAKHLLEIACRRSILIIPGAQGAPLRPSGASPSISQEASVHQPNLLRAHA